MSEKIVKRVLRIVLGVLLAISVVLMIKFVIDTYDVSDREVLMSAVEPMVDWTYVLLVVAAATAVIFPIIYIIQNPRKAVKALVSLVILAVVVGISYAMSDGTPIQTATSATNPDFSDVSVLKLTDTGIYTTAILVVSSIVLLILTGVRNIFMSR